MELGGAEIGRNISPPMKRKKSQSPSIPVIDLFAGPGGLGEGFSAFAYGGVEPFRLQLSIEKDPSAHDTLRLRAFCRQFGLSGLPGAYYDVLRGSSTIAELYFRFPIEAALADAEAWNATLGDLARSTLNQRIRTAIQGRDRWVLIGGPPCQAYSVVGRSRNRGIAGYTAESDHRQFLYVEYLQVIADHWPAVFVMENVKGLLSASVNDSHMFRRIVEDLTAPDGALKRENRPTTNKRRHTYRVVPVDASCTLLDGNGLADYLVQAERHGVPQARHRVILVGIRDDLGQAALAPLKSSDEVPSNQVLDRLPRLRSGLSGGADSAAAWLSALQTVPRSTWFSSLKRSGDSDVAQCIADTVSKLTAPRQDRGAHFIEGDFAPPYRQDWFLDRRLGGVIQHETRLHVQSDLHRYLFVASYGKWFGRSPRLRDMPRELLPEHANVQSALDFHGFFQDRFRVQLRNRAATTITSHIAKDGHSYIHSDPSQCRSLTLREAARLQTFPDNYYFAGARTKGYGQVGNAVPPLLAVQIAESIYGFLRGSGAV